MLILASSAKEIPADIFCLATEAAASEHRDAQLKGGHLLSCFSSPAQKCCECKQLGMTWSAVMLGGQADICESFKTPIAQPA